MVANKRQNKQIGDLGETIACNHLENKGYSIIARNYKKPWVEIDIIAEKNRCVHFVEVKTVSYETKGDLEAAISRGTRRPEENVHHSKIQRLNRAIETWIQENRYTGNWEIDVIAVRIVPVLVNMPDAALPNLLKSYIPYLTH